jgi:hypothetical protein
VSRRTGTLVLLGVCLVLWALSLLGVLPWGGRAAGSLLLATLIIRWGLASMRPMRVGEKSHEPVDVVEPGGLPVYTCVGCGTQLLLLRKGSERAPRHCGESMRYDVIAEADAGLDVGGQV